MKTTFTRLPLEEQKELLSKLAHLMRTDEFYYNQMVQLIRLGEVYNLFERVKFGNQVEQKLTS